MIAKVLARTNGMSDAEWMAQRRRGIGGSDIAAIAGLSPYENALTVYLDKIGQLPPKEETEEMHFGKVLEPIVASEFSRRLTKKVQRVNAVLQHPENLFMLANLDRLVVDPDRGRGILECKTTQEITKKWTKSELPEHYVLQTQWYMGVTGLKYAWIAVLISGSGWRFLCECIERDDDIIGYLTEIGKSFWYMVENRIPPAIDGSEKCSELLQLLYNNPQPTEVFLAENIALPLIQQYNSASENLKAAESLKREAQNKLEDLLGNNEIGSCGDIQVTWKPVTSNRIDTKTLKEAKPEIYEEFCKPSTSRRFHIKMPKEERSIV